MEGKEGEERKKEEKIDHLEENYCYLLASGD